MKNKRPRSPKQVAQLKAIQAAWVGRKHAPKAKAKMRANHKGFRGKRHSPKALAKMSAVQKGKIILPEQRAKLSAASKGNQNLLGYRHTPEARAKMSASQKGRYTGCKNPAWLGGISREPYGWEFNDELKEEVRRRDGCCCQRCGVPQAECDVALTVHHVDYDKKNSDPVNLVSLCISCHMKTNTNRKHWTAVFQAVAIKRSIAELEGRQ